MDFLFLLNEFLAFLLVFFSFVLGSGKCGFFMDFDLLLMMEIAFFGCVLFEYSDLFMVLSLFKNFEVFVFLMGFFLLFVFDIIFMWVMKFYKKFF